MAITYKVKTSQLDVNYGKAHSLGLFVDNDYGDGTIGTTGLALGRAVAIKSDGDTDAVSSTTATLQYADASTVKKMVGFVYRTSPRAVDTTVSDMLTTADQNYYPYGDREDTALTIIREGEIVVEDTTRDYHFNTYKKTLTGTVEVASGDLDAVVGTGTAFTTELRVGDLIIVDGQTKEVASITSDTALGTTTAFSGAVAASEPIYGESDLFRPIYVGEDGLYTIVTPSTSTALSQKVGYVANGNNIHIDLSIDPDGSIIA